MEWKSPDNFVRRTFGLLVSYQGPYDVTHLLNCCLGLIVIAHERFRDRIPNVPIDDGWGIKKEQISESHRELRLPELVRHVRNAIAHFRVDESAPGGEITLLEFSDREGFRAEVGVQEFRQFAMRLAQTILETDEATISKKGRGASLNPHPTTPFPI